MRYVYVDRASLLAGEPAIIVRHDDTGDPGTAENCRGANLLGRVRIVQAPPQPTWDPEVKVWIEADHVKIIEEGS